ncbi:lipopolysaccharide biosynthesis protein [Mesorhizobium shangrilense]|uniref:Lipopolysaccharide biosynthesis protein n=1 Tax=Mesorhizobium shangrilense TaxID=460060 RepID=A0ABV2DGB4_9HYPH
MNDIAYAHLSSRRSIAAVRGVLWSTVNAAVPTISGSLVFIMSSRYLLPADFGLVALAGGLAALASAFAPGGFGDAVVQRSALQKTHLDTTFWLCIGSATIIYLLLFVLSAPIAGFVNQPDIVNLLRLLGCRVIFDLAAAVPNALITRSMLFGLTAMRTTIAATISGVLCVVMLIMGYGLWALAVSQLLISVVSCVAAFWSAGWRPGLDIRAQSVIDLAHYGMFASGSRFLQMMSIDQIIIGALVGPASLGVFNFAKRVCSMLNDIIAGALGGVSYTLLSSLQNERGKLKDAFLLGTFASAAISFPAFVGLAAIAADAIPEFFGAHWAEAVAPIQVFCAISLLGCIGSLQSALVTSQGKSDWWFWYQLASQLSNIAVVLLFYPYGITAITSAIAVKTLITWPVPIAMVTKLTGISPANYLRQFFPPAAASTLMVASIAGMNWYLSGASLLARVGAEVPVSGLVYIIVLSMLSRARLSYVLSLVRNRHRG